MPSLISLPGSMDDAAFNSGVTVAFDTIVRKKSAMNRYAIHRAVEGLAAGQGGCALFADGGDHFVMRTPAPIDMTSIPVVVPSVGTLAMFEVQALACKKVKGSRRWFDKNDWKARHDWLRRKGEHFGFEVPTVHASTEFLKVEKGDGVLLDTTIFTGVLRVLDADKFGVGLRDGIASGGRFAGLNMLRFV